MTQAGSVVAFVTLIYLLSCKKCVNENALDVLHCRITDRCCVKGDLVM